MNEYPINEMKTEDLEALADYFRTHNNNIEGFVAEAVRRIKNRGVSAIRVANLMIEIDMFKAGEKRLDEIEAELARR